MVGRSTAIQKTEKNVQHHINNTNHIGWKVALLTAIRLKASLFIGVLVCYLYVTYIHIVNHDTYMYMHAFGFTVQLTWT